MNNLTGNEIRTKFIEFFCKKQHTHFESASLIPEDPTLLLTVAGMVPFKDYFMGYREAPTARITSYQKCIRANDLENVGKTARHHTFFEMLGNFSFGDYFKKEAIMWSWEFITEVLKLDKEKLWISVFRTDNESEKIWHEKIGVPLKRVIKLDEDDNWWSAGSTGSCGPCSEIHYDLGVKYGGDKDSVLGDEDTDDRFIEIWNLVFTEWNKLEDGTLVPLSKKNIDTGAGLERVAAIIQKKENNFETDLLFPILLEVSKLTNTDYTYMKNPREDLSLKVITDHIRAVVFMIGDGILPSNDGKGYVLRMILRRAVRHGRLLGNKNIFLYKLVDIVINIMKEPYPDLVNKKEHIVKMIKIEEEKFSHTLDQGLIIALEEIRKVKDQNKKKLDADIVFKLHDTYGFPYELMEEICEEEGVFISRDEYDLKMNEQRLRARTSRSTVNIARRDDLMESFYELHGATKFIGYSKLESISKLLCYRELKSGDSIMMFDSTPFYAESGGQKADSGKILGDGIEIEVSDVKKIKDIFSHKVKILKGKEKIVEGMELNLIINKNKRNEIKKNHTATHLLHSALKKVLGEHVSQAGSLVNDDRLRFDFSHYEMVTRDQLEEVEKIVNEEIAKNKMIIISNMSIKEAKKDGVIALFGEKYGSNVRVVKIGNFSKELCGGTHVDRTGEIGLFNILTETGIASGTRRIEATTGFRSYKIVNKMERAAIKLSKILKTDPFHGHLIEKATKVVDDLKIATQEIKLLKSKLVSYEVNAIFEKVEKIHGVPVLITKFKNKDHKFLRQIIDKTKDKFSSCIVVLGTDNGNAIFSVGVTNDLLNRVKAGELVGQIAKIANGNGGGKPNFAQAGGKNGDKVSEALKEAKKILESELKSD